MITFRICSGSNRMKEFKKKKYSKSSQSETGPRGKNVTVIMNIIHPSNYHIDSIIKTRIFLSFLKYHTRTTQVRNIRATLTIRIKKKRKKKYTDTY